MSRMARCQAICRIALQEYRLLFRRPGVSVSCGLLGALGYLYYTPYIYLFSTSPGAEQLARNSYFGIAAFLGALSLLFTFPIASFAMSGINTDRELRLLPFIFSSRVPSSTYVWAKFTGVALV